MAAKLELLLGEFRGLQRPPPEASDTTVDVAMKFSALEIIPKTASAAALADDDNGVDDECNEVADDGDVIPSAPPPPLHEVAGSA
jgi:hypothetical protein